MAREAMITINCERYSKKIIDVITMICNAGWTYYNENKFVRYLPLGDDDEFGWKSDLISDGEIYDLIDDKQQENELIGLEMYLDKSDIGITILARNTKEILINLDINRKTIDDSRDSFTDVGWYFYNLLKKIQSKGCAIDYICFEEYTD